MTFDPKLARCVASSIAASQPPITTIGLFLNIGRGPSQVAHAEIPFCRYLLSQGIHIRFAVAHVAMMSDCVSSISFPT